MRSFGSDNHSGVHSTILDAIVKANDNHCCAYGDDPWTERATARIKELFGADCHPFFVFNGTGANILSLRSSTQTFNSIISASTAHIAVDECGAPEFMTGASLKEIDTEDGKLTPELISRHLYDWGFEHHSQPKVVYISQCSELGTVYTTEEIRAIADYIHQYGMYLHIDGARIANAAVALGKSFKEITVDCGADILSFGGTKNGMMFGEAVIAFRPELAQNMKYIRKQSTQLFSKMRYISSQFLSYLHDDLWYHNALNANNMAQKLRKGLENIPFITFTQPTQANILLMTMPKDIIDTLLQKHFFYMWNESKNEIRLVTSWNTTEEDVDTFIEDVKKLQ